MNTKAKASVMSINASTLNGMLERDEIVLVDVRETSEYEQEHIPGAMLLPMSKFDPELFPSVPGKKVVLHCAVGKRSDSAGKMLLNEGYENAIHLAGGIEAWKAAGFATEVQFNPPAPANQETAKEEVFVPLCPSPGHVLREEYLEPLGITQEALADKIGVPAEIIAKLVDGRLVVTAELSLRLARYFSTAADFWVHLQTDHEMEEARRMYAEQFRKQIKPRTADH